MAGDKTFYALMKYSNLLCSNIRHRASYLNSFQYEIFLKINNIKLIKNYLNTNITKKSEIHIVDQEALTFPAPLTFGSS